MNLYKKLVESYGAEENDLNHDAGYLFDVNRCKEYLNALKKILVYNSDQYRANIANLDKGGECEITIDYYMLVALCKMYEERIAELESNDMNETEELNEARNPENDEANELIKKALNDRQFAVDHQDDLKKYGIDVDISRYSNGDIDDVHLKGKNGRKLKSRRYSSDRIEPDKESYYADGINNYNKETREYENYKDLNNDYMLGNRSYKERKEELNSLKKEVPKLEKKLAKIEKAEGKDSPNYRGTHFDLMNKKRDLDKGMYAKWTSGPLSDDVDYKNYLDSPFRSDRPQPYDPKKDKANADVRAYKDARAEERYNNREKEENLKRDKEEMDRIASYMKDYAENKERRDSATRRADEEIKTQLGKLRDKVAAKQAERLRKINGGE